MKKLACLFLAVAWTALPVLPCLADPAPSDSSRAARLQRSLECAGLGRNAGREASAGGAFVIGLVGGVTLGPIGTGVAWACQGNSKPPAAAIAGMNDVECGRSFTSAFGEEGRSRKRRMALVGGVIGTAILFAAAAQAAKSVSSPGLFESFGP